MSNLTVSRAEELAALVNEIESQIEGLSQSMVDRAIASGRHLIEIKEILPRGEFMRFCKEHVKVKRSQVQNYMNAASSADQLPNYHSSGNSEKGLIGFLEFISPPEKKAKAKKNPATEPEDEARHDDLEDAEPAKPYKPKVYDMPVNERLQSCALGVIQAGLQFFLANQETGGRLTHDQVVRAIQAELVTTSTPHPNKAKVYREAHEQTEQFLAVFAEAFAEISPAISLNKVSSI